MCEDNPGCGCLHPRVGNPVVIWPGYGVNPARNSGADLEPVPIVPLRHGNWTATQLQLKNGWQQTSFGKRLSYDSYRRLLQASNTSDTKNKNQLAGVARHPTGFVQPSGDQLANMVRANAGSWDNNGGTGQVLNNLNGRTFYG